jgi:hypothetical protein
MAQTEAVERCIPLSSPLEWKNALNGISHAFAHTWENCYAMSLSTRLPSYLYAYESPHARIVCPIAERRFDGYVDIVTPYGFSGFVGTGECPDFPSRWKRFVAEREYVCGYIQLNPLLSQTAPSASRAPFTYNSVYVIDLRASLDRVLAACERRRRKQIRDAERNGDRVLDDAGALEQFLLATHREFFERKHAAGVYAFSDDTIAFLCAADGVRLVGAGRAGLVEAVAMLAFTPYVGDALFQVSSEGAAHHAAAMVWERVKILKAAGVPFLNLGGGVVEDDSIAQFKRRFGAAKLPLQCLKQVYRPAIYERLCRETGANPHDLCGYFPPYRRAH